MNRSSFSSRRPVPSPLRVGVLLAIWLPTVATVGADEGAATLPYSVSLSEPFTIDGLPGLHSYAHARTDVDGTKWVIMSGRKNGLHGFLGFFEEEKDRIGENFPVSQAADRVWVVDIAGRKTWSAGLDGLPTGIAEQLRSTNAEFVQVRDRLYIAGGYGFSASATIPGKMITFDRLTAVDVPGLVRSVLKGEPIACHFEQVQHPGMKTTGGYLEEFDGRLCLVFGNSFDGLYSPSTQAPGTVFHQQYTEQVRTFRVHHHPLRIADYRAYPSTPLADATRPYHRRDGNMAPAISPKGRPRLGIYGGVFRPGQFEAYFNPIYIDGFIHGEFQPGIDQFQQLLNHYECPLLPVHDARTGTMSTTFFGGMSSFWYNEQTGDLIKDSVGIVDGDFIDGVPFIKSISTLVHRRDQTSVGYVLPISMPGWLGTSARLLPEPNLPRHENGVIRLEALKGPTTVGHIFGGIESGRPYGTGRKGNNPTWASDKLIPVVLTPGTWAVKPIPQPKTKADLTNKSGVAAATEGDGEQP